MVQGSRSLEHPIAEKLNGSIKRVMEWVEAHDYKGYDPADGNSSFFHPLTFGNVFLQRVLQQVVLRAPINVRPLLGVRPMDSTKGRGYMGWGYLKLYRQTGDERYKAKAMACLKWLMENHSPGYKQYCWGDHFNYATRTGKRPRFEPIIVWSSLIGQAFLDAQELLKEETYLDVAKSICDWILELPREKTSSGSCLSYVAYKQVSIHNSNMLGAAMLARTGTITGNTEALQVAREAMVYSCSRQLADGSWWYGEHPKYQWIDNFHTGYNLECLKQYMDCTGEKEFKTQLDRGLTFFKANFFETDGCPKYFHNRKYPVDIQSASQAIDTFAALSETNSECLPLACKVAGWTIDNMQAADGHFYYRDLGWKKVKTPMIHWGQATMFKAMTYLRGKLSQ